MSGGSENKQKTVVRGSGSVNEEDPEHPKNPEVVAATKNALGAMVEGMRPLVRDTEASSESGGKRRKKKGKGQGNNRTPKPKPENSEKKTPEELKKEEEEQKAVF